MRAHQSAGFAPAAYKPASSENAFAAFMATWRVLHDIQWRAPWDHR
jgi:hypothetical protein